MLDISRYFDEGAYECFGVSPKCWVASAVGAAIGLGSTLFGGMKPAEKDREQKRLRDANYNINEARIKANMEEDKNSRAVREAKEYGNTSLRKAQGSAAVGGATDASVALTKESDNKMIGNVMGQQAEIDDRRKENGVSMLTNIRNQKSAAEEQSLENDKNNISNVASAMGNAAMAIGSSLDSPTVKAEDATKSEGTVPVITLSASEKQDLDNLARSRKLAGELEVDKSKLVGEFTNNKTIGSIQEQLASGGKKAEERLKRNRY